MDGSNTVLVGTASGVVKARTSKRLPPGERGTGSLRDEALGSELAPDTLEDDGGNFGSERLCCNHTWQSLYRHWYLNFDRCDEGHCA